MSSLKLFAEANSNQAESKKFKAKYTLSDGLVSIIAIVVEQAFNRFAKAPQLFDVIRINNLQIVEVKGKRIMMLKDPIQIVAVNLSAKLGSPQDIAEVLKNQANFELDREFEIP